MSPWPRRAKILVNQEAVQGARFARNLRQSQRSPGNAPTHARGETKLEPLWFADQPCGRQSGAMSNMIVRYIMGPMLTGEKLPINAEEVRLTHRITSSKYTRRRAKRVGIRIYEWLSAYVCNSSWTLLNVTRRKTRVCDSVARVDWFGCLIGS